MLAISRQRQLAKNGKAVTTKMVTPQPSDSINAEVVNVTPEMAEQWLELNFSNRQVSDDRVKAYAHDMKRGAWLLNGQGISFSKTGQLLDGQHRLWAVMTAGVTVPLLVVRGIEHIARATIDKGRPRSLSDDFRMQLGMKNTSRMVSRIKIIGYLLSGSFRQGQFITYDQCVETYERFRDGLDWSIRVFPKSYGLGIASIAGSIAFAYPANPLAVGEFGEKLASGIGLESGEPAQLLRHYALERLPLLKEPASVIATKTLRMVFAHIRGERMAKLQGGSEGIAFFRKQAGIKEA